MPEHPGQMPYYVYMPRAISEGWSQRAFFEWARSKPSIWTARDATMRDKWHDLSLGASYVGAIERLREGQLVPKGYMSPLFYEGRTSPYTYTVSFRSRDVETGVMGTRRVSVLSDEMLTKGQVFARSQEWLTTQPELYGTEVEGMRIEMVEDQELGFRG